MLRFVEVGDQVSAPVAGFQPMAPETDPVKLPLPTDGTVWLTVRVNTTSPGIVAGFAPVVNPSRNWPMSTLFTGGAAVTMAELVYDSVNQPKTQLTAVQPVPLNAPDVWYVTVCAATGSDPSATATVPTSTARANPRTPMSSSSRSTQMRGFGQDVVVEPWAQPLVNERWFRWTDPVAGRVPTWNRGRQMS